VFLAQQKWNQNSTYAPVAVLEGVDCLELIVNQCKLDKKGQVFFRVDVFLKLVKQLRHPRHRRGDISRIFNPLAGIGDVILLNAKLAGPLFLPSNPMQQFFVNFTDQS